MQKLNLQITNTCNMECEFCCNTFQHQKDPKIDEVLENLEKLPKNDNFKIRITGGEPLLYKDILKLVMELKKDHVVSMETNGLLLEENRELVKYLDEIILPIDSGNQKTLQDMGRDKLQFWYTLKNIVFVRDVNPNIKITVTTVLNDINKTEIEQLATIMKLIFFDEWEIHQFLPHGKGKKNIKKFLLDDREFEEAILYLETTEEFTDLVNKITPYSVEKKFNEEWIISPSLDLVRLKDMKTSKYGNIKEMSSSLLEQLFISQKQYTKKTNR